MAVTELDFGEVVERTNALFAAITRLVRDETIAELMRLASSDASGFALGRGQDDLEKVATAPRRRKPPAIYLTTRQREVLRQLALGRAVKEIAFDLNVSPKTVATHRAHLMERLGIRDVAGLVVYAISHGIIDIPLESNNN